MTNRLARVKECHNCPHLTDYDGTHVGCYLIEPQRRILNSQRGIPSWCPLPEADMVDKVRAMVTAILEETVPSTEDTFPDGYKTGQRVLAGAVKTMLDKAG